ncbi:MAG TPA: hypothetical protein VHX37_13725 [Acidobacteriaceae bacterium]|jgi:tetratricopeptide (TPR) repeat protein|nr:hypothetical protein [Acidobacteriaceae bacterium]
MLQQILVFGAENLSQIAVLLFFLATVLLAFLVIRERRRGRRDLVHQVQAQLEKAMEKLNADATRTQEEARRELTALAKGKQAIQEETRDLGEQLAGAKEEIERLHAEVRRVRQQVTPLATSGETGWTSPDALLRLARQAENWQQAAEVLARIDLDSATSKNLECAGTICRKHGFFAKAVELYREATAKDPENLNARAELLALSAEIHAAERNDSLAKLQALVADTLVEGSDGAQIQSRLFATMIGLGRFREIADFCESQLRQPLSRASQSALHRSLAILYEDADHSEEALAHCEAALRLLGDDPVMLARYTRLLMSARKYDEAYRSVIRTLQQDPTSARGYIALAEIQEKRLGRSAARELLARALQWADATEMSTIEGQLRRLAALDELSEILPATQPQLIRA